MKFLKSIFIWLFLLSIFSLFSNPSLAQTDKLYSVFVYNFTKNLEWPPPNEDFTIVVLGNSKVYNELQLLIEKKKIYGHPIKLRKTDDINDIHDCNMIYISSNKSRQVKEIINKIKNQAVLLVGEQEGLTRKGIGISLFLNEDDNVKFEINKQAIENQQLKVSSTLLKLAQ